MAKQKQMWTMEEEEALRAGVGKHGQGKWKVILSDPEFTSALANRSNIDLKDKWRNLSGGHGSSSRENVRTTRLEVVTTNLTSTSPEPLTAVPLIEYGEKDALSKSTIDRRTAPDYEAMILEALLSIEGPNGPDTTAILGFIEQRYELPENYKRSVISKLRRLVLTGEIEKVDDHYKIKGAASGAETTQQGDVVPSNQDNNNNEGEEAPADGSDSPIATETLEDAASYAAYRIAVAENAQDKFIEALKEAERVEKLVQESIEMLKLAEELYQQCKSSEEGVVRIVP